MDNVAIKAHHRFFVVLWMIVLLLAITQPRASLAQGTTRDVVIISFTDAVMQTNEAKSDLASLQAKFAPRQAQVEKLNDDVESLRKQLSNAGEKLSEFEQNSRTQALAAKEKQLQRAEEDLRNDSQSEGQEAFQRVAQKLYTFLQDYAKQQGYAAVIDRGTDAAPVVWFALPSIDITASLAKAYNARSGVAAPEPSHSLPPKAPAPAKEHP